MLDLSDNNQILITIGVAAIIIEIILGAAAGFELFILGIIFIVAGTIGFYTSFQIALGLVIFLSALYLLVGRKFIKKRLSIATKATNTDNLLGRRARVVKAITAHNAGQVKIEGEIWRAVSDSPVEVDAKVEIKSVSGVTLHVEKI